MRVCERVFSVGFGPGFPQGIGAAGTHGWLPPKTGLPGLRRGGVGGYNLHSPPPPPIVAHQPRAGCIRLVYPKDIACAFNKQFINTIPHKTNTTNRKITTKVLRLQPTQINITTEQVQAEIKNSKNKYSTGPDNINIKHFNHIGKNGLKYLTNIYNAALNDNKIPHVWKLANIIPIPKPNKDINIGTSYRPMSLLSVIAKTLEKVILPHITQNIPNITTQHGF